MRRPLFFVTLFLLAGCDSTSGPADAAGPGPDAEAPDGGLSDAGAADGGRTDTGSPDAGEPDGGFCAENPLSLRVRVYGDTERYYVDVTRDGGQFALQLDTGSGLTFLFQPPSAPAYTPDLGTVGLGCQTLPVAGRNFAPPPDAIDGRPIIGLLGMNYLLARPALLDVAARRLTRLPHAAAQALAAQAKFAVGFDDVASHALVPCTLDGVRVRLMFDTGAGNTLWVGVDGRPGDREQQVVDGAGNVFPVYEGQGTLGLFDAGTRTIPLARAPRFPYFEQTVAALGGNLHGLLGVTAFPNEKLLFDGHARRIYVMP